MRPQFEAIPTNNEDARAVLADIGVTSKGINWAAPVIARYGIRAIPYFAVIDESGKIVAQGDAARQMISPWMKPAE